MAAILAKGSPTGAGPRSTTQAVVQESGPAMGLQNNLAYKYLFDQLQMAQAQTQVQAQMQVASQNPTISVLTGKSQPTNFTTDSTLHPKPLNRRANSKQRRYRTTFSASQLEQLEKAFMETQYPDVFTREAIAAAIDLRFWDIKIWTCTFILRLHVHTYKSLNLSPIRSSSPSLVPKPTGQAPKEDKKYA